MTISIGTVTLSEHLLLPGIKNIPLRAGSSRMTLGGRYVEQSIALESGQEIELVDPGSYGVLTGAQIDAINAYRASGEIVVFVHPQGTWNVLVVGVEVQLSDEVADPDSGDITYYGTITMRLTG